MTTHAITCNFPDGKKLSFNCEDGKTLIEGALDNHVILQTGCMNGFCATCKLLVTEGEYDFTTDISTDALPEFEQDDGYILGCVTQPASDLEIAIPYEFERVTYGSRLPKNDFTTTVSECGLVSSNVYRLVLQTISSDDSSPQTFDFVAGQYVNLKIPGTESQRSYSMASACTDKGQLEFLIRILPDGEFSDYLVNKISVGDRLDASGPEGIFNIRKVSNNDRYFVAGGTGVAPFLSMIRQMDKTSDTTPVKLFFGLSEMQEMFMDEFEQELSEIQSRLPNIERYYSMMNPDESWIGEQGTAVDTLKRELSSASKMPDIYLCGPPAMMTAAHDAAKAISSDIPGDFQIISEEFAASGGDQEN